MTTTQEAGLAPVVGGVPTEPGRSLRARPEPELPRDDRYLRLLLVLLVSAAFFEGYDSSILRGNHRSGAIGNVGDTVTALTLLVLLGLWLVWRYLSETRGQELEEISA